MAGKKETATRVRSAKTGEFVKKSEAKRRPAATVTEKIKPPKRE